MQIPRLKRFLFCIFLLFGILANAQDQDTSRLSLISYLQKLETQYNVKFSFVDEDLQDLQVLPVEEAELSAILRALEKETQLRFSKLSDRYFSITPSTTLDICGFVYDNFGQNTIPGASVEVLGSPMAVLTDMEGKFSLTNIPREAHLRIRFLGFKPRYISASELINNSDCPVLLLALNYQELEEVVVYQFLTTGISREKDGSILLDIEDFGILPGLSEPDILQTIQALPGIKSIDETVSDINIRGGTNDQNLILWDGIKMYQSGHFFGLISAFNPYLTDQVTIIKNGTSPQYGDGVSGIISMETKDEVQDGIFGGGGFNLISGDMYGHIPLSNRLAVQFSARRSVTDFLNTPTYNQFFERAFQDTEVKGNNGTDEQIDREENFYFYDFTAKVLYDINAYHKLRISAIQINNNLDYLETNQATNRTNQSLLDQTNFSFGGRLSSEWSDRFSTQINAYYTRYNLDAQNIEGNGQQTLFQNNRVLESSFKALSDYELTDELLTRNGYQFTEVGITNFTDVSQPPFMSNVKGVIRSHALFSELQFKSADQKFEFLGGARLNYLQNLGTFEEIILEPRLNMSYMLWPDFRLEFRGEFKNQTTNQVIDLEQNFLGIEKRRWILSDNDELPITKSKQASLGINYDKNRWFIGLEGFYKEVSGVSTATQGFQNEDQFNGELGSYTIKGGEFLVNYKNNRFSSWLSYAFNDNTYFFEDITPNEFPNNLDIRHTATLASTYNYRNLKLGIGLNYRTGKPYTKPQEGNNSIITTVFPNRINYQDPNSSRLPDYLRADASLIYNFKISEKVKASAGASVLNIFGKRNVLNIYYRLNEQNEIETVESISLGLTPNASFRVSF
ncbi:carboxypeptidase-like regulatory domain-containing protein [Muriicola sp. SD30]|uniref:TonB-dependent receptor n=1 Tax=Muriicola sp. SD30 TaxID=3240936 RepID=UPI00350FAF64